MDAPLFTCPTCKKEARPRAQNPSFPFCGSRCKLVDLGRWFDETYRVASSETPLGDDAARDDEPA
jgi:endogenous inhibitor of DNA gyrase (YacG/DUF329 family)